MNNQTVSIRMYKSFSEADLPALAFELSKRLLPDVVEVSTEQAEQIDVEIQPQQTIDVEISKGE